MQDPSDHPDPRLRALTAYDQLVSLAEEVEDEWSYVQDLAGAWRGDLERASATDGAVTSAAVGAIERLVEEISLITDPHRAIDWLSTFPQAVLLALGVDPWAAAS